MQDIVIVANFCRDFSETDNGRFHYLCKELSKAHHVEIITSDFSHGQKRHKQPPAQRPFQITLLHEPGYRRNISFRRFFSHRAWGNAVAKYLAARQKPDVVYCAVPSLTAPLAAAKYCEQNHIRFVVDVQDLWPEAFQLAFNVPVLKDIAFAPFRSMADGIYRRADAICAVSRTYADRAERVNRKGAPTHVVYLGTRLEDFDQNALRNPVEKEKGKLWLGYCGTLGANYDLTCVIDALAILKKKGIEPPRFMVFGDGERRREFENHARALGVDCLFTGRLPYPEMCGWLAACDMAANPIAHNAAGSIINKHGDYAAAALPVLNTQESSEYRELVDRYHMGFHCKNGDAEDVAKKLEVLIADAGLRAQMGKNARKCALERFDRARTYQELVRAVEHNG